MNDIEKITAAAMRNDGKVYTGKTHFQIMRELIASPDMEGQDVAKWLLTAEDGFVTTTGRFVDREEAFEIARSAAQIVNNDLVDPEKNKAFYGTQKPSLDSGIVEYYEPAPRNDLITA